MRAAAGAGPYAELATPASAGTGSYAEAFAAPKDRPQVNHTKRALIAYIGITAFCLLFSNVYNLFGHDVHSPFMTFLFVIPLVAGVAVAGVRMAIGAAEAPRGARYAYHCAVATLTVASALRGVFDIAGTSSPWLIVYLAASAVLLIAAVCLYRRAAR